MITCAIIDDDNMSRSQQAEDDEMADTESDVGNPAHKRTQQMRLATTSPRKGVST